MTVLDLSAKDIAAQVQSGAVTPQAVAEAALARAHTRNPAINAICAINPAFMAEAEIVAHRLAAGEVLPLAGVPVLIKDNIWVKGMNISQGSLLFADFIAPEDAESVALLRAAGAMILGISTCSEFACKGVTNSPRHGVTRNPYDLALTPGGSSGGAVAAVAAGIVPLALGTDAGGSSRRPPAHVGLVGLKPTLDLVPDGPGFSEPVWGISVICPIAKNTGDIALAMQVLTGITPVEPGDIQIGFAPSFGLSQVLEPDVAANFAQVIAAIKTAGGSTQEAELNWTVPVPSSAIMPLQFAGLAHLYGNDWLTRPQLFDPDIGKQIETGLKLTGTEVAAAHQASHQIKQTLCTALDRYGVIATPTTPCPAWPADQLAPSTIAGKPAEPRDHAAFTSQINHAGVPAISLPCGFDRNGLPLGLQLIAGAGQDAMLLGLAQRLEPILAPLLQRTAPL